MYIPFSIIAMLLDLVEFGGAIAMCCIRCLNNVGIAGLGIVTSGVGPVCHNG